MAGHDQGIVYPLWTGGRCAAFITLVNDVSWHLRCSCVPQLAVACMLAIGVSFIGGSAMNWQALFTDGFPGGLLR